MIKNISIYYWHLSNPYPNELSWEHGQVIECKNRKKYLKKLKKMIDETEAAGCNVMLLHNVSAETTIFYIDNGRFKQC